MKVTFVSEPFHHILIEGFFSDDELKYVWEEIDLLSRPNIFSSTATGSAKKDRQTLFTKRTGVFLDKLYYQNRESSPILNYNRKVFNKQVINPESLWFFKDLKINKDFTLVSYYGDGGYYDRHYDSCTATVLTWLYKEPKSFEGGNLIFSDYKYSIECKSNHSIIFPSQIMHEVTHISMAKDDENLKMGRYCISQFLHVA